MSVLYRVKFRDNLIWEIKAKKDCTVDELKKILEDMGGPWAEQTQFFFSGGDSAFTRLDGKKVLGEGETDVHGISSKPFIIVPPAGDSKYELYAGPAITMGDLYVRITRLTGIPMNLLNLCSWNGSSYKNLVVPKEILDKRGKPFEKYTLYDFNVTPGSSLLITLSLP